MKARWIAGGLVAGLVLGTIIPVAAQYAVIGALAGLGPGATALVACLTVTGAPRSGIKPTATDSSGSYIDISCPP